MKFFIAGIMQGSFQGKGIQEQDYRQSIRKTITAQHPDAEIVDPFSLFPDSVSYDEQRARQVLFDMAEQAGSADVLIAYLPAASMGTALEMIRAYDNGKTIISITPMDENWLIKALSNEIFASLDEFCEFAKGTDFTKLINDDGNENKEVSDESN